ncbi:unnamed protein product [Rotaria sp. Silwood2]|nr:unnamed protein product [Rotaria sp. Silwood2]CAF2749109.1 unnamed protein product [Rotaria sp. Silwood2]CAF3184728.1 unnamed protein product [Rotaria sp. Silwood2]CAF4152365.1 unnamed protein product [Rotaria sp. Silwood2]CAF4275841.1 unnamed protein product [Rotaria sp. Silwood2]
MNIGKASSSGHIIEFNQDNGTGFIEEDTTKQILLVHFNSFKRHSRRYVTGDKKYIGELFDFDIIVKEKTDDNGNNTSEAVNVRHRVLKCHIEECSRIKAFTNVKALEDHINIRHLTKKKERETSQSSSVLKKKSNKRRRQRPQPILVTLTNNVTDATIGRFIGKQGDNLKRIQQQNQIKLQLLNTRQAHNTLQILIKPNAGVKIDINLVRKSLKSEWERSVHEQQAHERFRVQRLDSSDSSEELTSPLLDKDSRYRADSKTQHSKQLKQRLRRQTEPSVRVQECHSSLYLEGHRSVATCDSVYRQKSIFNYSHPKIKKSMKEKQWLVNEQLQDLERFSD